MNTPAVLRLLLALVLLTDAPLGCKPERRTTPTNTGPVTVPMRIGSETFHLEIADSEAERKRGLMFRESMPADHGMIFVFADEEELSFWMESTLIPLDILYLDRTGKLVSIKPMKPRDRTGVSSDGPAMYAVELNRGAAARAGVAVGDRLTLPAELRKPAQSDR